MEPMIGLQKVGAHDEEGNQPEGTTDEIEGYHGLCLGEPR